MVLRTFNRQYRHLGVRLFLIVVLAAVQPLLWRLVASTAHQVHLKRSQQEQIVEVKNRVAQITQAQQEAQALVDQAHTVVPPQGALPKILERVERLALEQQVALTIRDIVEAVPREDEETNLGVLPVHVTAEVKGAPSAMLAFLDAVERLPELAVLKGWSVQVTTVSPLPGASPSVVNTLTTTIIFFVQNGDAQTK